VELRGSEALMTDRRLFQVSGVPERKLVSPCKVTECMAHDFVENILPSGQEILPFYMKPEGSWLCP
jgi:hypothetical protein